MKISNLSAKANGSNATIEMEPGDGLSIKFVDLSGTSRIVTVDVQGKVMLLTDVKTDSNLLVRMRGVAFHDGEKLC
jgi:hypothetical protein